MPSLKNWDKYYGGFHALVNVGVHMNNAGEKGMAKLHVHVYMQRKETQSQQTARIRYIIKRTLEVSSLENIHTYDGLHVLVNVGVHMNNADKKGVDGFTHIMYYIHLS